MRPIDADIVLLAIDKLSKTCGSHKYLNWDILRGFVEKFPTLEYNEINLEEHYEKD